MHICFVCAKSIDSSICLYQKNFYHAECCHICTPNPVKTTPAPVIENKTPPPPPPKKIEIADPKKARANPGRLSFAYIGSFESSKDVLCCDCKKKITGQRFLAHKQGEYRCNLCNAKFEDKCHMCKKAFETEECFKDDDGNKCCAKCIKLVLIEKKKKELEKQKSASTATPKPTLAAPVLPDAISVKKTSTIHCDNCTKYLTSDFVEFDGGNYHQDCLACYSCKKVLKGQKIYKEEKGLACEKCKQQLKCK